MRWKEILTGALVTLAITILAGVIVFYVTVPRLPNAEKLTFQIAAPFAFISQNTRDSFQSMSVANLGGQAAHDVSVTVRYSGEVRLVDHALSFSAGMSSLDKDVSTDHELQIHIATLVPHERVTVSMMLSGVLDKAPDIGVRSNATVGSEGLVDDNIEAFKKSRRHQLLGYLIAAIATIQLPLLFFIRRWASSLSELAPKSRSLNDTAFLYLHLGLREEAERILRRAIARGGADALMLANYGLALGLRGDYESAMKHLEGARFYASKNKHEQAVVSFNRALLLYQNDRATEAEIELRSALEGSDEIRRYLDFSEVIKEAQSRFPELRGFLLSLTSSTSH